MSHKKSFRRISLLLAACLSLTVIASGCSKNNGDAEESQATNVITQAGDSAQGDAAVTETTPFEPGEVVTEADGQTVTGVDGEVVTAPATSALPSETLSPEQLESIANETTVSRTPVITQSPVASSERYAYNTLSDDEKALYDAIVKAAELTSSKIRGTDDLSIDEWAKILGMVYNQEPQLFWLDSYSKKGRIYFIVRDADEIASMQKEIDETVNKLLSEAETKSSVFDKLLVFHDYLALNTTFEKTDDKAAFNSSIYNAFGQGAGKQGSIQCIGYAKAMQYLCDKAGIECMVITGTNDKDATHAWNKVKVDGEWYNLDCTWDDPILDPPDITNIRYNYFLVPDKWINEKTHYNINVKGDGVYFNPPAATATAQNYFIKKGLVYNDKDSADAALKAAIDTAAASKLHTAEIMVGSQEVYDQITKQLSSYQKYAKDKYSSVSKLSDNCNENMLLINVSLFY